MLTEGDQVFLAVDIRLTGKLPLQLTVQDLASLRRMFRTEFTGKQPPVMGAGDHVFAVGRKRGHQNRILIARKTSYLITLTTPDSDGAVFSGSNYPLPV